MEDRVMGRPPVRVLASRVPETAGDSVSRMGGPLLAVEPYVSRRSTHGTKTGLPVLLSDTVIFAGAPTVDRSASREHPSSPIPSLGAGSIPSTSSTPAAAQQEVMLRLKPTGPSTLPPDNCP